MSKMFSSKKGELSELKDELHSQDKSVKTNALKKVIAQMTVGKDVSSLFADVVLCMQTSNVEVKKLVYLFIANYAKSQPELAILAVNTFRKDATDPSPLVRALAVRTMGCIRLDQVSEYLLEPLRRCCSDPDPYVRRTAMTCISKVHTINPSLVVDEGFMATLVSGISDNNNTVVCAALSSIISLASLTALILTPEDKSNIVTRLLQILNDCSEWGQVAILDALAGPYLIDYNKNKSAVGVTPDSILEKVIPRLSHSNHAVVLSSINLILHLLEHCAEPPPTLPRRLLPALTALLSAERPEHQHVALNVVVVMERLRRDFRNTKRGVCCECLLEALNINSVFCKYSDPVFLKNKKMEVISILANPKNLQRCLDELVDYSRDCDIDFARCAVRVMGQIALGLDDVVDVDVVVDRLLEVVVGGVDYLVEEAVVSFRNILRRHACNEKINNIIEAFCSNLAGLDKEDAKISLIWLIGEHCERLSNASDIFSEFLSSIQEDSLPVQSALMTALVKYFLKNPNNAQSLVMAALSTITTTCLDVDLRSRAFFYWRLLATNPNSAKQIVLCDRPAISVESFLVPVKDVVDDLANQLCFSRVAAL